LDRTPKGIRGKDTGRWPIRKKRKHFTPEKNFTTKVTMEGYALKRAGDRVGLGSKGTRWGTPVHSIMSGENLGKSADLALWVKSTTRGDKEEEYLSPGEIRA